MDNQESRVGNRQSAYSNQQSGTGNRKSVLILGATTGIGRALAAEFAAHHYDVLITGRDPGELEALAADLTLRFGSSVGTHCLEVTDFAQIAPVLETCLARAGDSLAGVVVSIGYLGDAEAARSDSEEALRILETNFTGPVLALNFVAGYLERKRRGFLCALGSVAGDRGRQSNYLYGAAKAGLAACLGGLRQRLHPAGVRVITVKPGFVDTRMTYGRPRLFLVASTERVARGIYRAIARGQDVVYLPWFWKYIMLTVRALPERMFKRLRA